MTRVIQTRQVRRHTQAGVILYGFGFVFYQSEGIDATLLDVSQLFACIFFLWKCAFHRRTEKKKKNLKHWCFKNLFFFSRTPHPLESILTQCLWGEMHLKDYFHGSCAFDSQFEVTASCKVESGVTGFYTLDSHSDELGSELSSMTCHSLLIQFLICTHPPCCPMTALACLLDDAHEMHSKWNVSNAETMKDRAADLK